MKRRALWEVVNELVESVRPSDTESTLVRINRLDITLPVEIALGMKDGELTLYADAPRWRWRSEFDARPSRMSMTLAALDPTADDEEAA